jgi:hypothetical protein
VTLHVVEPNTIDTRSTFADWLELQVLTSRRGLATPATLSNVLDIVSDSAIDRIPLFDPETNEFLDGEIVEAERDANVLAAFEELEYRERILEESYPFQLDDEGRTLKLRSGDTLGHVGRAVYLFCLLVSALREKRIRRLDGHPITNGDIAAAFQVCSCLAAGGYLGGEVASFGFPRTDGSGFLTALRRAYERFGAGRVREQILDGFPKDAKDAGIDVIAWRHHPDRMPGKVYLLGQCASGGNWRDKSVRSYVRAFHEAWFSMSPATDTFPALFIPFMIHSDLQDAISTPWPEVVRDRFRYQEMHYGIVFDRMRVAHYANVCCRLGGEQLSMVDGSDQLERVQSWVRTALSLLDSEDRQ